VPLFNDVDGHNLKPDPLTASTPAELEELLRAFWVWAGKPSCRDIARQSEGAFSRGTISNLLFDNDRKPPLKLSYLQGCIQGCGGDTEEVQTWTTAWRKVNIPKRTDGDGIHA
jgi:hypothetical protein